MAATITEALRKANGSQPSAWSAAWSLLKRTASKVGIGKAAHTLRLGETLSLGDRRFLAVVNWEQDTLLVGVTSQNVTLVARRRSQEGRREEFVWEKERTVEQ